MPTLDAIANAILSRVDIKELKSKFDSILASEIDNQIKFKCLCNYLGLLLNNVNDKCSSYFESEVIFQLQKLKENEKVPLDGIPMSSSWYIKPINKDL